MKNYYDEKLNAENMFRVYETALPRVRQYLQAEIDFVKERLSKTQRVLELGAGYGRIVRELAPCCGEILGIDSSKDSVELGKAYLKDCPNAALEVMDVHQMAFSQLFDVILCLQNGLSAMRADAAMVQAVLDALTPGGTAYFSSYSARFWDCRLAWFEEQAEKGLLGEIDREKTKDGVIVCKDGFRAVTYSPDDLRRIGEASGCAYEVREVDESSVFLILRKNG